MLNLDNLFQAAKLLYSQTEQYRDNETQVKVLVDDIKKITDIVTGDTRKGDFFDEDGDPKDDDNLRPALEDLYRCIKDTQEFVNEFKQSYEKSTEKAFKFLQKFIKAGGYAKRIAEVYERLRSCESRLAVGGVLQGLQDSKKYEQARQADVGRLQEQLETIKQSVREGTVQLELKAEFTNEKVSQMIVQLAELKKISDSRSTSITHTVHIKETGTFIDAPVGIRGGALDLPSSLMTPELVSRVIDDRKNEVKNIVEAVNQLTLEDKNLGQERTTQVTVDKAEQSEHYGKAYAEGGAIKISQSTVTTFNKKPSEKAQTASTGPSSSASSSSSRSTGITNRPQAPGRK